MNAQLALFGKEPPGFAEDPSSHRRQDLGSGAWVVTSDGWLRGHAQVFETVLATTHWQSDRRQMYERVVQVPRLTARFPEHGRGHPILADMARALSARYGQCLDQISAAYYRDGRDSVALHGDRVGRGKDDCVVAIVSLGEPRRFLLKPVCGGPSRAYRIGFGDLLVMGGTCQRTWLHGVPKVVRAGPRISIQFRPAAATAD